MKNNYAVPNAEILLFLTKDDILTSSPTNPNPTPNPNPPDIGVEDEGDF